MRRFLILLVVFALAAAAYVLIESPRVTASGAPTSGNNTAPNAPVLAPTATTGVQANATPIPVNIDIGSMASPRVLAFNPNTAQLGWVAAGGGSVVVAKASSGKALMLFCGLNSAGDKAIVYEGGDTAQAFLMPLASGAAMPLGANIGLACALPGRTQFSPDGNRLGILKYASTIGNQAGVQQFAPGTLRILKMPDGTEQAAIDNTITFDLQNDGAVLLQFFTNTKGQANSADLVFWDGSKTRKIEENIQLLNIDPKADCAFVAAKVLRINDKVYTLFGERCKQGGSTWRLRVADFAGGNGKDVASGPTGSGGNASYFLSTDVNDMTLMPSGKELMFTVPNGTAADIANIARITIPDGKLNTVATGAVVPSYPSTRPTQFARTPKGDVLAYATRNGDGTEQLFVYDLNSPDKQPASVAGGNKGDRINGIAWSGDGQTLFYNIIGTSQALFAYGLKGDNRLVARGTFENLVLSADGTLAAMSEVTKPTPTDTRHNLVAIKTDDGTKTDILDGAKGDQALSPLAVR